MSEEEKANLKEENLPDLEQLIAVKGNKPVIRGFLQQYTKFIQEQINVDNLENYRDFFTNDLPPIYKFFVLKENAENEQCYKYLTEFQSSILTLLISSNFSEIVENVVATAISPEEKREFKNINEKEASEKFIQSLLHENSIEKKVVDSASPSVASLASAFFQVRAFQYLDEKPIDVFKYRKIIELFIKIEPYLTKEVCSASVVYSSKNIMRLLEENNQLPDDFLLFLVEYLSKASRMLHGLTDQLVSILCDCYNRLEDNNARKQKFVTHVVTIADSGLILTSAKKLKEVLLDCLKYTTDSALVYSFYLSLVDVSKKLPFKQSDAKILLSHGKTNKETVSKAIMSIYANTKEPLNEIALKIFPYGVITPELHTFLAERCDEEYAKVFFCQIVHNCKNFEMKTSLAGSAAPSTSKQPEIFFKFFQDELNTGEENLTMEEMGYMLMRLLKSDLVIMYIEKLFQLNTISPEIEQILIELPNRFTKAEFEKSLLSFFNIVMDIMGQNAQDENPIFIQKMCKILITWISSNRSQALLESQTNQPFNQIDFSKCHPCFPQILQCIAERTSNKRAMRLLIQRILKDTVPPRLSLWFMHFVLTSIREEKRDAEKVIEALSSALQEPDKLKNSLQMIISIAKLEADYYRIGDEFGFVQPIIIYHNNKAIESQVSLHQFHTTRRFYNEIAHILGTHPNNLQLSYIDDANISSSSESEDEIENTTDNNEDEQHASKPKKSIQQIVEEAYQNEVPLRKDNALTNLPLSFKKPIRIIAVVENNTVNAPTHISTRSKNNAQQNEDDNEIKGAIILELIAVNDISNILFNQISRFNIQSQEIYVLLELLGKTDYSAPVPSEFQNIFLKRFQFSFEYADNYRIFPYVLKNAAEMGQKLDDQQLEQTLQKLATVPFDKVGLSLACQSILKMSQPVVFSYSLLKNCLIQSGHMILRQTVATLVSDKTPKEVFIHLLPITVMVENRSKTKEFFELEMVKSLETHYFDDIFNDLKQSEVTHYSDNDETFVHLTKLISKNDENKQKIYNMLFAPPTCQSYTLPFLQTYESRKAAIDYLSHFDCYDQVSSLVEKADFSSVESLSDDFSYIPHNVIKGLDSFTFPSQKYSINDDLNIHSNKKKKDEGKEDEYSKDLAQINPRSKKFNYMPQISPLPALLQCLIGLTRFVSIFTKIDDNRATDFIKDLRDLVIRVRYDRSPGVSIEKLLKYRKIQDLVYKMPPSVLTSLLSHISYELNDYSKVLNELFELHILDQNIRDENERNAMRSKYCIELTTNGFSSLQESLDNFMETHEIRQWSKYLIISLDRGSYQAEKYTHEFQFPTYLDKPGNSDQSYTLCGVIIHSGKSLQTGKYKALSASEDRDWYVCEDEQIMYYDLKDLPYWAFGITEGEEQGLTSSNSSFAMKDFYTASMLFYVSSNITCSASELSVPPNVTEEIDKTNCETWPSRVCNCEQFSNLALSQFHGEKDRRKFFLSIFFPIGLFTSNNARWCENIRKYVLVDKEGIDMFFTELNDLDLPKAAEENKTAVEQLIDLVIEALKIISTKLKIKKPKHEKKALPRRSTRRTRRRGTSDESNEDEESQKQETSTNEEEDQQQSSTETEIHERDSPTEIVYSYFKMILEQFEIVKDAETYDLLCKFIIEFMEFKEVTNDISLFSKIIEVISLNKPLSLIKHSVAINDLINKILENVLKAIERGQEMQISEPESQSITQFEEIDRQEHLNPLAFAEIILTKEFLTTFSKIISSSDVFAQLIETIANINAMILVDVENLLPHKVNALIHTELSTNEAILQIPEIPFEEVDSTLSEFIFSENEEARSIVYDALYELLGPTDPKIVNYLHCALINPDEEPPELVEMTSTYFVISFIPAALELLEKTQAVDRVEKYIRLLNDLSLRSPQVTARHLNDIVKFLPYFSDEIADSLFYAIVHSLLIDDNYIDDLHPLLNYDKGSREGIQLLLLLKDKASNKPLSGACVEYCFKHEYDDATDALVSLIERNELVPCQFDISKIGESLTNLKLAIAISHVVDPQMKKKLDPKLKNLMKKAKKHPIFAYSDTVMKN